MNIIEKQQELEEAAQTNKPIEEKKEKFFMVKGLFLHGKEAGRHRNCYHLTTVNERPGEPAGLLDIPSKLLYFYPYKQAFRILKSEFWEANADGTPCLSPYKARKVREAKGPRRKKAAKK